MPAENLTIIGCSAFGREAVRYLVPRVKLVEKTLLVVPHIKNNAIYYDLEDLGVPVESINLGNFEGVEVDFETGKVYILGGNLPNLYTLDGVSFLSNGQRISAIDKDGANLDPVICGLVNIFREKTTGVILTGAGDDGIVGAKAINRNKGKIFAQTDSPKSSREFEPWGYSGSMPQAIMKAARVDFMGTLSELVGVINNDK